MNALLTSEELLALQRIDTCTVANAIETFDVRLRDEGYALSTIHSVFPELPPVTGYAVPIKVRCSGHPTGAEAYRNRTDWWDYLLTIPKPRVVVIQDTDEKPGTGAFLGEVHANILQALDCVAVVTNGAVRDLPAVRAMQFPLFAGCVAVSHAYVHIVEYGTPVKVGGLTISPGDLLHGDCHGVLSVPNAIAGQIPTVAAGIRSCERKLIELCRSRDFSIETLRRALNGQS